MKRGRGVDFIPRAEGGWREYFGSPGGDPPVNHADFRGKGSVAGARVCCGKVDGASAQLAPHGGETTHPGVHCGDRKCGTRPAVAEREECGAFTWAAQGGKGEVGRGAGEKSAQPPIYSFFQFSIFCFPISFLFQIQLRF
jgi:hypothetical protein